MKRTLFLSLLGLAIALVLALGSVDADKVRKERTPSVPDTETEGKGK